jgi:hypothetical protein
MPSLMLPCKLTNEDRFCFNEVATTEIKAREQVEAAKKEAVRSFNVALKAHKAKEHDFNESLFSGTELRDVEIEERPDYAAGIVFVHRLDTGDCCQQRAIDPDERQVKLNVDGPKVDGKVDDVTDEQIEAASPDEAEQLRAERLAGERAERISAGVTEARGRIAVVPQMQGEEVIGYMATLQFGNRVIEVGNSQEQAACDAVCAQVTEILEAEEAEHVATWADAAAASEAEQKRQEIERLAAEQARDEATTPKKGFKKGLQAPKRKKAAKGITVVDGEGKVLFDGAADDIEGAANAAAEHVMSKAAETKTYFGTTDDMQPVNDAARAAEAEKDDEGKPVTEKDLAF